MGEPANFVVLAGEIFPLSGFCSFLHCVSPHNSLGFNHDTLENYPHNGRTTGSRRRGNNSCARRHSDQRNDQDLSVPLWGVQVQTLLRRQPQESQLERKKLISRFRARVGE